MTKENHSQGASTPTGRLNPDTSTLSDKITLVQEYDLAMLNVEDVKEFIQRLKDEYSKMFHGNNYIEILNKLAGDKLSK